MKNERVSISIPVMLFLAAFMTVSVSAAAEPVLVWGVSAVSDLPQDQVNFVGSSLADEVGRTAGMDAVDQDAVDEGLDMAMDNGECAENNLACVVEVARALGVDEAVSGDLGIVNGIYILTVRRIDVESGTVIRQVTGQTEAGLDTLIRSMSDMVANLYGISHHQMGFIRTTQHTDSYDYVIVTYGPDFSWIRPVHLIGYYPWWWSGPVHYYHHHYRWYGWHNRHPQGRPHYTGARRPYPSRHHRDARHAPAGNHRDKRYKSGPPVNDDHHVRTKGDRSPGRAVDSPRARTVTPKHDRNVPGSVRKNQSRDRHPAVRGTTGDRNKSGTIERKDKRKAKPADKSKSRSKSKSRGKPGGNQKGAPRTDGRKG